MRRKSISILSMLLTVIMLFSLLPANVLAAANPSSTGTVASSPAVSITSQPSDVYCQPGASASFSVVASGTGLTYQWYYKRTDMPDFLAWSNQTTNTLSFDVASRHDSMQVYCIVKDANKNTVTSNTATVYVGSDPIVITSQPSNVYCQSGDTAVFTVGATGTGLTYQWYYKRTDMPSFTAWTTAKEATLSFASASRHENMQVYCVVKNAGGRTVTTNTVAVVFGAEPSTTFEITSQPSDFYGKSGDTAVFTVGATGVGLTYQWYYKRTDMPGFVTWTTAKEATLSFAAASRHENMEVYCVVKDANGDTLTTDTVAVVYGASFEITSQPEDAYRISGASVDFTIETTGTGLTYQWYYKRTDMASFTAWSNQTTTTLQFDVASRHNGMQVYCVVKDSHGNTVNSDVATLNIVTDLPNPPAVTYFNDSIETLTDNEFTMVIAATGEGLSYQWQRCTGINNGVKIFEDIPGATNSIYVDTQTYTNQDSSVGYDLVYYNVVVTDRYGQSISKQVEVSVRAPGVEITTNQTDVYFSGRNDGTLEIDCVGAVASLRWQYLSSTGKWVTITTSSATYTWLSNNGLFVDGRQFRCLVMDYSGVIYYSDIFTVHRISPIVFFQLPHDVSVIEGEDATLSVRAGGSIAGYQWYVSEYDEDGYYDFVAIPGATSPVLEINNAQLGEHNLSYCCGVIDVGGHEYSTRSVIVYVIPRFTLESDYEDEYYARTNESIDLYVNVSYSNGEYYGESYNWEMSFDNGTTWFDTYFDSSCYSLWMSEEYDGIKLRCRVDHLGAQVEYSKVTTLHFVEDDSSGFEYTGNVYALVGEEVTLKINLPGNYTYRWNTYDDNSFPISVDCTGSSYSFVASLPDGVDYNSYEYYVVLINPDGSVQTTYVMDVCVARNLISSNTTDFITTETNYDISVNCNFETLTRDWQMSLDGETWFSFAQGAYAEVVETESCVRYYRCVVTDLFGHTATTDVITGTFDICQHENTYYSCTGNLMHELKCSYCYDVLDVDHCVDNNGDNKCDVCLASMTCNHDETNVIDNGDGTHTVRCFFCSESLETDSHIFATQNGDFVMVNGELCCEMMCTYCEATSLEIVTVARISPMSNLDIMISAHEIVVLSICPTESGVYDIYSMGELDTIVRIYDSSLRQIVLDDDGGSGYNFETAQYLEAGSVYYIVVSAYGGESGLTTVCISEPSEC